MPNTLILRRKKAYLFRLRCTDHWLADLQTFALLHEFDASDIVRRATSDYIARAKAATNPALQNGRAA